MGYDSEMIRKSTLLWGFAALLLSCSPLAAAATVHSINYSYYPVTGRTPAEVYRSILRRGPTVNGDKAIASTTAQGVQNYSLAQQPTSCRVNDQRLDFRFDIQLPRPIYVSALTPRDRALWQNFSVFLRAHELQHTKLWLGCAADLERKVLAINARSCDDAKSQAEALWRKMRASCDKLQANFDREQRGELLAQPFMQRVLRGN